MASYLRRNPRLTGRAGLHRKCKWHLRRPNDVSRAGVLKSKSQISFKELLLKFIHRISAIHLRIKGTKQINISPIAIEPMPILLKIFA